MSAKRKLMAIKAKRARKEAPEPEPTPPAVDDVEEGASSESFDEAGDEEEEEEEEGDHQEEDDAEGHEEEDDDDEEEEEGAKEESDKESEVEDEEVDWAGFCERHSIERRLARGMEALQWTRPTLVQRAAIPVALAGRDVLIRARTGSGKTACYAVPVLQRVLERQAALRADEEGGVLAVVLAPTRELVAQARKQLLALAAYCRDVVHVVALMGESPEQDASTARKASVLVATPGALNDALKCVEAASSSSSSAHEGGPKQALASLRETVVAYVIDEADLVLSFGSEEDVDAVLSRLGVKGAEGRGGKAQGFLLSATLGSDVLSLKRVALRRAATIRLNEDAGVFGGERDDESQLAQYYVAVQPADKLLVVYVMLKLALLDGRGILFVNSVDACYRLRLFLDLFSIRTLVLNAELPLSSRLHVIESFNRGFYDLLVATDASIEANAGSGGGGGDDDASEIEPPAKKARRKKGAADDGGAADGSEALREEQYGVARGIDFQNVKWVLNVDLPVSPDSYTHRIGRTARAGARGTALTLVSTKDPLERGRLAAIQAVQPQTRLVALSNGGACDVVAQMGTTSVPGGQSDGAGAVVAQPCPLAFDAGACEPFRYRVADIQRGVTRAAIREARAAELRREILNSADLAAHFESNPDDLAVLKHDRAELHVRRELIAENVKHIPSYLVPQALRNVGAAPRTTFRRKKKAKDSKRDHAAAAKLAADGSAPRNKDNDPLQSFDASALDEKKTPGPAVYRMDDPEFKNQTTSLRAQWKKDHKKGDFGSRKGNKGKRKGGDQAAFARKKF